MFKLSIQDFQYFLRYFRYLFDFDNMRSGDSLGRIRQWGCLDGLTSQLKTHPQHGLADNAQLRKERIRMYGENIIGRGEKSVLIMFYQNFEDQTLRILCIASVISLIIDVVTQGIIIGLTNFLSIMFILIINISVLVGYRIIKERKIKQIKRVPDIKKVKVYRHGKMCTIKAQQLLVGDIQLLECGQIVSADGLLIESNRLSVDQSSMTGECIQIKKSTPTWAAPNEKNNPFIISSSKIMEGTGKMIVLAVGSSSQYGILQRRIQYDDDESPLQLSIFELAQRIGAFGFKIQILIFLCYLCHICYSLHQAQNFFSNLFSLLTLQKLLVRFIEVLSLYFIIIPESMYFLPQFIYVFKVQNLKSQNILVRNLNSFEVMGCINNLLLEKEQIIAKNQFIVTKIFTTITSNTLITPNCINKNISWLFSIAVSSTTKNNPIFSQIGKSKNDKNRNDAIECALLEAVYLLGYDYEIIRKQHFTIMKNTSYSNEAKKYYYTALVSSKGKKYLFLRGFPGHLQSKCLYYLDTEGNSIKISDQYKNILNKEINKMAHENLIIHIIAFRMCQMDINTIDQDLPNDFTIIGMVAIKESIRDSAPNAIKQLKKAGISVRMLTGQSVDLAIAVAKQANILEEDQEGQYSVMTGLQFQNSLGNLIYNDKGQQIIQGAQKSLKIIQEMKVLARSTFNHQEMLVVALKKFNKVIAMTGNYAYVLKKANLGLAMNTDYRYDIDETLGVIIQDSNFDSILTLIKQGRNLFESVQKGFEAHITMVVCTISIELARTLFLGKKSFQAIHYIWINTFMSSITIVSLVTSSLSDQVMKQKVRSKAQSLISYSSIKQIIFQTILQLIILTILLLTQANLFNIASRGQQLSNQSAKQYSIFFNTFFLLQIFNIVNCRRQNIQGTKSFRNILTNHKFINALLITFLAQFIIIEYGGAIFKTTSLSIKEHFLCYFLGMLPLLLRYFVAICQDFMRYFSDISKNEQDKTQ